jgi:DNA-directed RNA polymerase subunit D
MKLEEVEESEDVLKLRLEGANDAIANSLRRAMIARVPTLATDELYISKNDSGLFDEVIANRVGQIPFTIPQGFDEEDELHIAVKQEGPTTVTAEDISTDNEEAEPVSDPIIVELNEGEELEFEAQAVLGQGKDHAKHQGGTVGYEKTDDGYLFRIESTSGYDNRELLQNAIEMLREDLEEFEEALEDL